MASFSLQGRVALITGAASGIGRALALTLAGRGCHLALVDIDAPGLADVARASATSRLRISQHCLDVADAAAIAALPAEIRTVQGGVDLLVNNAGVALGGSFEQVSQSDFEWLFAINVLGVVRMTRAFLPLLRLRDEARIVNMSSVFGLIAPPGQVAYVASKFAVRGFSEALRHELTGSSVGVTTVHPGGVATRIAASARVPSDADPQEAERQKRAFEAMLRLSPAVAAERIVDAVERRKARIIIGRDATLAALIERLFPVSNVPLLMRLARMSGARSA